MVQGKAAVLALILACPPGLGQTNSAPARSQPAPNEVPEPGFTDYDPTVRPYALYASAAIWPFADEATQRLLYVCWESLAASSAVDRDLVRSAVRQTWSLSSRLIFSGWQECAANNFGVRIRVADEGPHVKALGRLLDGVKNGMTLNFTFQRWGTTCAESPSKRRSCIYSIAVHEFGHAIGISHEQNRFDTPGECRVLKDGPTGDLLLTPYDPSSVMNYCNERYNNNGKLSVLDVKAVREIYGAPP